MCAWDFCMWVIFEKQMYCWPRSLCSGVENKLLILLSELIHSNHNQLFKCWKWAFFWQKNIQNTKRFTDSKLSQNWCQHPHWFYQQIFCMLWWQAMQNIFKFTFWNNLDILGNCWILAEISIILTRRKHYKNKTW